MPKVYCFIAWSGTGKTTLLIDRLCVSVLVQQTDIGKLVALTFTDKAAADIKSRMMEKLQQVIADIKTKADGTGGYDETQDPDEETERTLFLLRNYFGKQPYEKLLSRAERALADFEQARIGTIHAFCADILKSYPLEAGISPDPKIDSGQQGALIFDDYWNAFLDEELGPRATHRDAWKKVLPQIPLGQLRALAAVLCKGTVEHYDYYQSRGLLLQVCRTRLARAKVLATAYMEPNQKIRGIEKALNLAAQSLADTCAFLTDGLTPELIKAYPFPKAGKVKGWPEDRYQEAVEIIEFAKSVSPQRQDLFLTAYHLIEPVVAQVRARYARDGILSFDDLLVKTRNLLRDNLYVRQSLKREFSALFIDEFQDTDPVQGEILLFLGEEKKSSAARWSEVKLEKGKLFVVGDPKQSIYRFRGADITAYERFTELILSQGGKKCFLQRNFRSTPQIVDVANAVCSLAMKPLPDFQPAYVPIFSSKTEPAGSSVNWIFIAQDGQNAAKSDEYRENQAEQIARWIGQNVGKMRLQDGSLLDYKHIALLFEVKTSMAVYAGALRRHGIAFNTETGTEFLGAQETADLLNLLRAVSNPKDKTALAGVLRSPFGGLDDEEIYQTVQRGELSIWARTRNRKLAAVYTQLKELAAYCRRQPLHALLEHILQDTFFPEACMAAYQGERTWGNLRQAARLVQNYPPDRPVSVETFVADTQQLRANKPEGLKLSPVDETLDGVTLMTVHKSKGLEFPVAILCELTRTKKNQEKDGILFSWEKDLYGLKTGKLCDLNYALLREEKKKHEQCEEVRRLYVALTRAREKLVLCGDVRAYAEKQAGPFVAAGLFPATEEPSAEKPAAALRAGDREVPVLRMKYEEPKQFIYNTSGAETAAAVAYDIGAWEQADRARRQAYEADSAHQKTLPSGGEQLLSPEQNAAAELGTLCHRILDRLLGGEKGPLPRVCAETAAACGFAHRAGEAEKMLGAFVQSALWAQITACRVLGREMPFSVLDSDGTLVTGVMDAVLETPDGSVWVVDYKTDRIRAGREQKVTAEKYARQIGIYKRAAQQIFAEKAVTASAVFVRTGGRADV